MAWGGVGRSQGLAELLHTSPRGCQGLEGRRAFSGSPGQWVSGGVRLEVGRDADEEMRLQDPMNPQIRNPRGYEKGKQGRESRELLKPQESWSPASFPWGNGSDGVTVIIANHYSLVL